MVDIRAAMQKEQFFERKANQNILKYSAEDVARLTISASEERKDWLKNKVVSKEFILMDVPLNSVAILNSKEKLTLKASLESDKPLVVDINKNRAGRTNSGFIPPVIVIEGSARHTAARLKGKQVVKCWVGIKAARLLRIYADDQFGSQELQDKIGEQLREKYQKKNKNSNKGDMATPYPWIREVYPFENYCVFSYDGNLYRQKFKTDLKKRSVTLDGDPEEVVQKYVDVGASTPMDKAIALHSDVPRVAPNGNKEKTVAGGFKYNITSPGSGVGPRVEVKK